MSTQRVHSLGAKSTEPADWKGYWVLSDPQSQLAFSPNTGRQATGGVLQLGSDLRMRRSRTPLHWVGWWCLLLVFLGGSLGCRNVGFLDHAAAQPQPSQPTAFNLGKFWKIQEGYYDEPHWVGVWTRRGDSNVFDATWKHCWMNETKQDIVEVHLAKDGQIIVFRKGVNQYYRGTYSIEHPNRLRGRGDWYGPDLIWKAEIEY